MMEEEIVGFRFYPTPGELVNHYLRRKLQKIDHGELCVIPELNIYDYDPRDLLAIYNEKSCIRSDNSGGCFFLCPRGTNSSTSKKNCNKRRAGNGYWKETSKKQDVEDEETGRVIGTKRIFAYYEGNQKNGSKTDLASHEYHLTEAIPDGSIADPVMSSSICLFPFPRVHSLDLDLVFSFHTWRRNIPFAT
ncbi:hypothetical protein SAY86_000931 [Trapa natans]|uniref:NAC domain-containing protein n=1 Tax=Trapa natans TaxID=22666 RepID=A0AAN7RNE6_TRANT|nr:hypothetical protein SAY86_000931 [Trapa natans]